MRADDSAAGKNGKCKDCGNIVRVPAPSPAPVYVQQHAIPTAPVKPPQPQQERVLYKKHPAMFRNRPILFLLFVAMIVIYGAGLVLLLIWWLRDLGITLTVTDKRTTLRHGILSKSITEIWHRDVRNVLVSQSFLQRIFGVGSIGVSSAGGPGLEIQVHGMAMPYKVKQIIDAGR
jgi:membrane protein YdbS with pleckstrin-like domain